MYRLLLDLKLALACLRRYQSTPVLLHDTSSATYFASYFPNLLVALAK